MIEKIRKCFPNIFQEVTSEYADNLTYVEFLMGLLKKINEIADVVNAQGEQIDEFNGELARISALYAELTARVDAMPTLMDEKIAALRLSLEALIDQRINAVSVRITEEVARLDQRINDVVVGQIVVFDPTTGEYSDLQTVLNNIYNGSRENALTATEYDELELTATAYDAYELTAYDYDTKGKALLV